jgi:1-acyl-sn-glycerol-3-phosphate acyltransferase
MAQVIPLERGRRKGRAVPRGDLCSAVTAEGRPCRNRARTNGFCAVHQPPVAPERIGPFEADRVAEALDFLRHRVLGHYEVDPFGFDPEFTERVLLPMVKPLYQYYWRAEWLGIQNVPSVGPALLAANHAGTVPVDSLVMKFGLLDRHPAHRHVRLLAADLAFRMPFIGTLARKMGATLACEEDAHRLLQQGELVGVFPEGYKGVGKGWRERYRLQRFGRGGFVQVALRERVPIVPVSIVGSEEIYPMIANARTIARIADLPYFPITPFFPLLGPLGLVPLPSKWLLEFGEPVRTDAYDAGAAEDPMLVFNVTDQVRETIQQTLYSLLVQRESVFR